MTTLTEGVGSILDVSESDGFARKRNALASSSSSAARVFRPCPNFLNLSRRPKNVSCGRGQVAKMTRSNHKYVSSDRPWHKISLEATMVLVSRMHTLKHQPKPQPEGVIISGGNPQQMRISVHTQENPWNSIWSF